MDETSPCGIAWLQLLGEFYNNKLIIRVVIDIFAPVENIGTPSDSLAIFAPFFM